MPSVPPPEDARPLLAGYEARAEGASGELARRSGPSLGLSGSSIGDAEAVRSLESCSQPTPWSSSPSDLMQLSALATHSIG